jgi:hypothetical protein
MTDATNEDIKGAEEQLSSMGLEGKLVKRFIGSVKAKGRGGKAFIDTLAIMGEATKLSQMAEKEYWDANKDSPKSKADYDRAEELADRSIKMLDKAMFAFPSTIGTLMPLKEKAMIQKRDIIYQRYGIVKSPIDLKAEVENMIQSGEQNAKEDTKDETDLQTLS